MVRRTSKSLSQESYDRFGHDIKPGGVLIVDNTMITEKEDLGDIKVYASPITETTKLKLDKIVVANMVVLTVTNEIVGLVDPENLLKAILSRVPPKFADLNKEAFGLGQEIAKELMS